MRTLVTRYFYVQLLCLWAIGLAGVFLWSLTSVQSVQAVGRKTNALTLIEATSRTAVVELLINDYTIQEAGQGAMRFHQVIMPNAHPLDIPGAPQLPMFGTALGLPTTDKVSLEIVQADYEEVTGYALPPAPAPVLLQDDFTNPASIRIEEQLHPAAAIYQHDQFYPAAPAALGEIDYLREQPLVTLSLYPVRYNPVRHTLRIYQRLVVRVAWDAQVQAAGQPARGDSAVYEALMQQLFLNYHTLNRQSPERLKIGASSLPAAGPVQAQAQVTNAPAVKIGVNERGIYQIKYENLPPAFQEHLNSNPGQQLVLQNHGQEVAIDVHGAAGGHFGPGDTILFYGIANDEDYKPTTYTTTRPYTTTNVYWLSTVAGNAARIPQRDHTAVTPPHTNFYTVTIHAEENTNSWLNMPGDDAERWFWGNRLTPNTEHYPISRTYPITLTQVAYTNNPFSVKVRLKGVTPTPHQTRIHVNGRAGDVMNWHGLAAVIQPFSVDGNPLVAQQGLLQESVKITVETVPVTTALDQIVVDWIEITYWRHYVAEADALLFDLPASGQQTFQVRGFSRPDIELWKVTDPRLPVRMAYGAADAAPDGSYQLTFQDNLLTPQRYLAEASTKYKMPVYMQMDTPSSLRALPAQTDYLIITHQLFKPAAEKLAAHRRTMGINKVLVVDVEDIYDEFNAGLLSPVAIRDFLAHTVHTAKATAATYVLFLGDANGDFLNYAHSDKPNFVPTQTILSRFFGEVPSDQWLVQLDATGILPDLLAGRLPAQTLAQANAMVDKIIAYETAAAGEWQRHLLLVADGSDRDAHNPIGRFEQYAREIGDRFPPLPTNPFIKTTVFPDDYRAQAPRTLIAQALNAGQALVTYFGHGDYVGWGLSNNTSDSSRYLFHNDDVVHLQNEHRLPVIAVANCLNGFFNGSLAQDSIAELLVRTPKVGAVAVIAPSAYERPSVHSRLMRGLYDEIFVNNNLSLGYAMQQAGMSAYAENDNFRDIITTYLLFGDPATTLQIAPNPPYVKQTSPDNGAVAVAVDTALRIVFSKKMAPASLQIESSPPFNFTPIWQDGGTTVELTPTAALAFGAAYTVNIKANDTATKPGPGTASYRWSFHTTSDQPPRAAIYIQWGVPAATSATSPLQIAFSEPVITTTVTFALIPQTGSSSVKGFLQWIDAQTALYIHEPFTLGQTYTFQLLTVEDRTNNLVENPAQQTFVVQEPSITALPIVAR